MKTKLFFINKLIFKLVLIYLVLIILPLSIIIIFISGSLSNQVTKIAGDFVISNLKSISINVDEILRNVDFSFKPYLTDRVFVENVKNLKPPELRLGYDDNKIPWDISDFILGNSFNNNYIYSIYLYSYTGKTFFNPRTPNGVGILNNFDPSNTQWLNLYKARRINDLWTLSPSVNDSEKILFNCKEIKGFDGAQKQALISININTNTIKDILKKNDFLPSGCLFVTDKKSGIISYTRSIPKESINSILGNISDNKDSGQFTIKLNKVNTLVSYFRSRYSGFVYVSSAPLKVVNTTYKTINYYPIIIFFFVLLIFIIGVFISYFYLIKPIRKLFSAMKKLEKGDLNVQIDDTQHDEIGYINKNFNRMVSNLRKLIEENYINKLLKKDAQLKSVLSQINEHFLYNTLDTIHWTARQYNATKVCDIIFSLSKFYRLSLSSGKDVVSISQIIEIINNYIFIQKFRMQEGLEFELVVDDTLLDVKVLKYLFQPLIENAILHGISKKPEGGKIKVVFERSDDLIKFIVEDNGVGMDKEKLEAIITSLSSEQEIENHNFALRNINTQLKIFYGNKYSINIESIRNEGTKVWFYFPTIIERRVADVEITDNR